MSTLYTGIFTYVCWILLVFVVLYKSLAQSRTISIQQWIGKFQWPLVTAVSIMLLYLWGFGEFIYYQWGGTKTSIPSYMSMLGLIIPSFSLGFMCLLVWHVYIHGEHAHDRRKEQAERAEEERNRHVFMTEWTNIGRHVEVKDDNGTRREAKIFGLTDTIIEQAMKQRKSTNVTNEVTESNEDDTMQETKHYYKVYMPPFHKKVEREPKDVKFVYEGQNFYQMTSVKDEAPLGIILLPGVFLVMMMRAQNCIMPAIEELAHSGHVHDSTSLVAITRYEAAHSFAMFYEAMVLFSCGCLFVTHFSLADSMKKIGTGIKYMNNKIQTRVRSIADVENQNTSSYVTKFQEDHKKFARMAVDHWYSMTYGGLLGVWSYVLGNVLNTVTWMSLTILIDTAPAMVLKVGKIFLAKHIYDKLGWLNNCITILCVYNIGIILQMRELKEKHALGQNAAIKFLPLRIFMLLTQFQPFILVHFGCQHTTLAFNLVTSRFWSLLLMHIWCAMFIVWNYFIWQIKPSSQKAQPLLDEKS